MNGYHVDRPRFSVGDLVFIDKLVYSILTDKTVEIDAPAAAVIVGYRTNLWLKTNIIPTDGTRCFDYQVLISGEIFWVYEDEIIS